jgi:hypothetical protein
MSTASAINLEITTWRDEQLRTKEFHEQRVEERAHTEASR